MKPTSLHAGNVRIWLANELKNRQEKSPNFSLRAFAKRLQISPAGISQVISGKRPLTKKMAEKISTGLDLDPKTSSQLISAASRKKTNHTTNLEDKNFQDIELDKFEAISDWKYFAVLGLSHVVENRFDAHWVADRLDISTSEAASILDRLQRLNLIAERNGSITQTGQRISTPAGITSRAVRRFHRGLLSKSEESLDAVPTEERDFSAMTLAIDPQRIDEARHLIKTFRREFRQTMEIGNEQRVYALAVQFFPLDRRRNDDVD